MAKRKRLSAFGMVGEADQPQPIVHGVPPVARIAADAAAQAALDDLADEWRRAREEGRMIIDLPLQAVETTHLHRDRMHLDSEDMAALKASIADRGQQAPIEVVALANGRYGLISGARRLAALTELRDAATLGEDRAKFMTVKALLRPYAAAPEAYLAMVEENEIRSDLSFYERGRLAHEAARIGVFESPPAAVKALFVHVSASKRSKILNFVALHDALGWALRFPEAIPEKLGLALVKAIGHDPQLSVEIARQLKSAAPTSAAEERTLLEQALQPKKLTGEVMAHADEIDQETGEGIRMKGRPGRVTLTGKGVTGDLLRELADWLEAR